MWETFHTWPCLRPAGPWNNPLKGGRKRIHYEPVHAGQRNLTHRVGISTSDSASLDPSLNSYPSGEIYLYFIITKTRLYNFDPLKPHFYTVKLGFTGVNIIFLISAQNIDCGYSFELPCRGGSNEFPQSMFWAEIWKKNKKILSENFQFLEVKFSIYLNRCVFVMMDTHDGFL